MTLDVSKKYQPQLHWPLEHFQFHSHYNVSDKCCCMCCIGDRSRKGPHVVQGVSCGVHGTLGYTENYWPAIAIGYHKFCSVRRNVFVFRCQKFRRQFVSK